MTQLCKTSFFARCSSAVELCGTHSSCCKTSAQGFSASGHIMLDFLNNEKCIQSVGVNDGGQRGFFVKAWEL